MYPRIQVAWTYNHTLSNAEKKVPSVRQKILTDIEKKTKSSCKASCVTRKGQSFNSNIPV